MKSLLDHNLSATRQYSIKIFISIAEINELRLFSIDINEAYIQRELQCKCFVKPKKQIGLESDKVVKLKNILYRSTENGDCWSRTFSKHLDEDSEISWRTLGSAIFYNLESRSLLEL